MKKHLRLWSVVLTAFMLIGVMAAVALAADQVTITGGTGKLPKGNVYIGDKFTKLTFKVSFDSSADQKAAKIKWKATNLPAGLKLTAKDATATLEGTYSKASKSVDDEKNTYEITATDSVSGFEWTSGDTVVIWGKPEFKTDTTKALSAKTGEKGIKFKIDTKNPIASYDVKISKDTAVTAEKGFSLPGGTAQILIDEEKSKSNSIAFTGSFDRVVAGGKELTMTVTIKVPSGDIKETYAAADYYAISKDFKIKITGVAPKFAKGDFSFEKGGDDSFDFTLSAGTPDIQWKAYIDEKTVQKLTGDKKAKQIDLPSADKKYDPFTKLGFIASTDGTSRIVFDLTSVDKVAFKKLPVTVEAWNDEINKTKHSKGKLTVTVDGTAPYLTLNGANAATLHPAGETSYDKTVSMDEIDNKVELKVKAGASFDAFTISVDGGQPIAITVKPEKKNGIVAKISGDAVYFSGTTDKATKDTTTKFSVEAKNNSTGAKAKADVIITAVPKPTLASGQSTIAPKAVVWGKSVKAAPKLTATNKNVQWVITQISADKTIYKDINATEEAQTEAISSLDVYGLTLDTAKGTLSAKKIAYVTGNNNPISITYYASGDIESSDLVTANFTVLGEAVKVTTKGPIKLSVSSKDMQEVKLADLMIETNLKDVTSGEKRASVDWTLDLKGIKEITSASVTRSGDVGGYATLSVDLTKAKVTNKVTLPIKFKNYGTESSGKITVAIGGATPIISADKVTVAKAGGNGKTTVKITNSSLVSDKLKWKIETKPTVKGITASLKADKAGTTATLEIKVGDKVEDATDTVSVSVTDSVTKSTSDTIDIPITITTPYVPKDDGSALEADETSSALEADDTASSKEAKVLGEGTVTMGHQRTVASLTAGQRAQIEAQGYIVAAVLPEIEVDADGQYDFEVDLDADERVKAGDELVWFAFASKPTTDDEIVDFEDVDGNETKVVPEIAEGHEHPVVVAWPWLNAGTKYAPVIAVKADAAEADAMTEEGVKEAAEEAKEE